LRCIGVICVIQHLIFGRRYVYRLSFYFLCKEENTRISAL
jgi:hypothetical protein